MAVVAQGRPGSERNVSLSFSGSSRGGLLLLFLHRLLLEDGVIVSGICLGIAPAWRDERRPGVSRAEEEETSRPESRVPASAAGTHQTEPA